MIKSKEEQERIMIACHASPQGKSSGLARIQNFKPINIVRQSNTSGGGGRGGGGGIMHSCDRPNKSGEGRVGQINTSGGRREG